MAVTVIVAMIVTVIMAVTVTVTETVTVIETGDYMKNKKPKLNVWNCVL